MASLDSTVNRQKTLRLRLRSRSTSHHGRVTRKSFGKRSWRTHQWTLLIQPYITLEPEAAAALVLPIFSIPMGTCRPLIPTVGCPLRILRSALPGCDYQPVALDVVRYFVDEDCSCSYFQVF
ncbi:hypothetical protein PILCRDRAFT_405130 [Piloderma croceum F 1598]|uniref:Uncharacterized protein n=1 Tax=Piloderma croceum (strain F 1598) TaxID=765440 RepID=A0A0C3G0P9_PILCF|nr:hypothetical protein PILCRDRAFT_405130 [Piloderma croceum F 1598]